jgi:hypothetical protein
VAGLCLQAQPDDPGVEVPEKLTTMCEGGEPTRLRAVPAEFGGEDWRPRKASDPEPLRKAALTASNPALTQTAIADFLASGYVSSLRHIRRQLQRKVGQMTRRIREDVSRKAPRSPGRPTVFLLRARTAAAARER